MVTQKTQLMKIINDFLFSKDDKKLEEKLAPITNINGIETAGIAIMDGQNFIRGIYLDGSKKDSKNELLCIIDEKNNLQCWSISPANYKGLFSFFTNYKTTVGSKIVRKPHA